MEEVIKLVIDKYSIDLSGDVEMLKVKLPFCGRSEGCKNLKYCGGLYTQCSKETEKEYCKVCQIEVNSGGNKYGNIYDREKVELGKFIANTGKQEIEYLKYMKIHGYSKEIVIEAANFRKVTLPKGIFEKKVKEGKREVEVSDTCSESSDVVKRGRGRPKKENKEVEVEKDEKVKENELGEESEEESEEIEVRRFKYKGKEYLKDVNDNTLYTADGDIIGIYNENTDSID